MPTMPSILDRFPVLEKSFTSLLPSSSMGSSVLSERASSLSVRRVPSPSEMSLSASISAPMPLQEPRLLASFTPVASRLFQRKYSKSEGEHDLSSSNRTMPRPVVNTPQIVAVEDAEEGDDLFTPDPYNEEEYQIEPQWMPLPPSEAPTPVPSPVPNDTSLTAGSTHEYELYSTDDEMMEDIVSSSDYPLPLTDVDAEAAAIWSAIESIPDAELDAHQYLNLSRTRQVYDDTKVLVLSGGVMLGPQPGGVTLLTFLPKRALTTSPFESPSPAYEELPSTASNRAPPPPPLHLKSSTLNFEIEDDYSDYFSTPASRKIDWSQEVEVEEATIRPLRFRSYAAAAASSLHSPTFGATGLERERASLYSSFSKERGLRRKRSRDDHNVRRTLKRSQSQSDSSLRPRVGSPSANPRPDKQRSASRWSRVQSTPVMTNSASLSDTIEEARKKAFASMQSRRRERSSTLESISVPTPTSASPLTTPATSLFSPVSPTSTLPSPAYIMYPAPSYTRLANKFSALALGLSSFKDSDVYEREPPAEEGEPDEDEEEGMNAKYTMRATFPILIHGMEGLMDVDSPSDTAPTVQRSYPISNHTGPD